MSYNGSVGEAFYQAEAFFASDDVNVLYPRGFDLPTGRGIFVCTLIRQERYRYNYGRKWRIEQMRNTIIRLPVTHEGCPDWDWVDSFTSALPWAAGAA